MYTHTATIVTVAKSTQCSRILYPWGGPPTNNLSAVWQMNYILLKTKISNCPNMLTSQVRDRGGAQEEPYMGVQSAHVRPGNPRTGNGPSGLAIPASENETPVNVSLEAEDAHTPGRGSSKDETDPHGSILIGEVEISDAHRKN